MTLDTRVLNARTRPLWLFPPHHVPVEQGQIYPQPEADTKGRPSLRPPSDKGVPPAPLFTATLLQLEIGHSQLAGRWGTIDLDGARPHLRPEAGPRPDNGVPPAWPRAARLKELVCLENIVIGQRRQNAGRAGDNSGGAVRAQRESGVGAGASGAGAESGPADLSSAASVPLAFPACPCRRG